MIKINDLYVDDLMTKVVIDNKISSQYIDYKDVFSEEKANTLIEHNFQNHVIDINDQKSLFDSMYNLSVTELEVLRKYIDEHFEKRFIILFISSTEKISSSKRYCRALRAQNDLSKKKDL